MDVYFFNSQTGYASGYGLFYTTNGGLNWYKRIHSNECLITIKFLNTITGWSVNYPGHIIKTTDSGSNWLNYSTEIIFDIYDIKMTNAQTGFASCADGSIIKTTNGGINWLRTQNGFLDNFNFYFLNSSTGWANSYEKFIKTTNGGLNWIYISPLQLNFNFPKSIYFINENTGWVGNDSGLVFRTTNSGYNWNSYSLNTNARIIKITALDNNTLLVITNSIDTSSPGIYRSSTSGITWQKIKSGQYSTMSFINPNTGWIGTAGGVLEKTTNSGLNWFEVTYMPNSNIFCNIKFLNDMTGWSVYGDASYKTTNGGYNWIYKNINAPTGIFAFDFVDENTGWGAASFGLIIKTTNGGLIAVNPISTEIPKSFSLYQNYPNPFNPSTKIKFDIPNSPFEGRRSASEEGKGDVKLVIYDALGKEVSVLVNEQLKPGTYEVEWNAQNYPSGVYFYRIVSGEFILTRKMVLIK